MSGTPATDDTTKATPARRPRSRWKRRLLVLMLLLCGLVAAAPAIVARTALRHEVVPYLFPTFTGQLIFDEGSLGWFRPVSLRKITLHDADGTAVATADEAVSSLTLLDMLLAPSRLGTITIRGLQVNAEIAPDSSNVERLLDSLTSDDESNEPYPQLTVAIPEARITWVEAHPDAGALSVRDASWTLDGRSQRFAGTLASDSADGRGAGRLHLEGTYDDNAGLAGRISAEQFSLARLQPLLTRIGRPETAAGVWTGQWAAAGILSETTERSIAGDSEIRQLDVADGNRSLLTLSRATFALDASTTDGVWTVRRLEGETDFGNLALDGATQLPPLDQFRDPAATLRALLSRPMSLKGNVDLAQLTERFPGLLTLRENVRVTAGTCDVSLVSEPIAGGARLKANAAMHKLVAATPERQLVWDAPFVAAFDVRSEGEVWTLDELRVTSRAIDVRGSGSWTQAEISVNCDLAEFAREWGQVVDFGTALPSGTLQGKVISRQLADNRIHLTGDFDGRRLSLGLPAAAPRTFPVLALHGEATGQLDSARQIAWHSMTAKLTTERETLSATLVETEHAASNLAARDWDLTANGTLEHLSREFGLTLPGETLSGRYRAAGRLTISPEEFVVSKLQAEIENLVWAYGGRQLDEDKVVIEGGVRIGRTEPIWNSEALTINSRTAALRLTNLDLTLPETGPRLTGQLAGRGRIERVLAALDPEGTTLPRAAGMLNLQLSADSTRERSSLTWKLFSEELTWSAPTDRSAAVENVESSGSAVFDHAREEISLAGCSFDVGFLTITADGTVRAWRTLPVAELNGVCRYDWATLSQRFPALADSGIALTGRHTAPFAVTFPFDATAGADRLTGGFDVQWQTARFENLDFGPSTLAVRLKPRRVEIEPAELKVAAGTMRLSPAVQFRPNGAWLEQTPIKLIDQVQLNEPICQQWLRYVSPLTADATRVSGTFSVHLTENLAVPLERWQAMTGRAIVDIARAEMRPGPMAMQFVAFGRQLDAIRRGAPLAAANANDPKALLIIDQQKVPVVIQKRRVEHRNLTMQIRGLNVRTSGTVGFDDSLNLVAEIDIPANWTANGKPIRDTWGESIRIPVRGTLSNPQLDPRIAQNLLNQLLKSKVNNLLEDELKKLLQPK